MHNYRDINADVFERCPFVHSFNFTFLKFKSKQLVTEDLDIFLCMFAADISNHESPKIYFLYYLCHLGKDSEIVFRCLLHGLEYSLLS